MPSHLITIWTQPGPMCDVKLWIVSAFVHIFGFFYVTHKWWDNLVTLYKASSFVQSVKRYQIKFHFSIVGRK